MLRNLFWLGDGHRGHRRRGNSFALNGSLRRSRRPKLREFSLEIRDALRQRSKLCGYGSLVILIHPVTR
jgi:hypothetical protein